MNPQNLLFVTEFVQLKALIVEDEWLREQINEDLAQSHRLRLPPELPLSIIAETFMKTKEDVSSNLLDADNEGVIDAFYASMRALYLKYIEEDCAPLEVNISWKKRKQIASEFEREINVECVEHILNAMEECTEEIISVLTGAAMRFSRQKRSHTLQLEAIQSESVPRR